MQRRLTQSLETIMANYRPIDLEFEEARYLANLTGIDYDLKKTVEWCDKYNGLMSDRKVMWVIEPLTVAILTQFIRAFSSGVRNNNAGHLLHSLSEDQKTRYEHFKDIRDKHIAHSVNEYESNHVRAYYDSDQPELVISSIGSGGDRVVGLSGNNIYEIRDICILLQDKLKTEINNEKEKLLEITKDFTTEDIRKMKTNAPKHTSNIDASKSRK